MTNILLVLWYNLRTVSPWFPETIKIEIMLILIALIQPILAIRSDFKSTCAIFPEKIDAVFTWVNGSDPWFMKGEGFY